MTKSEALEILKKINIPSECEMHEAFNMAVTALENKYEIEQAQENDDTWNAIVDLFNKYYGLPTSKLVEALALYVEHERFKAKVDGGMYAINKVKESFGVKA